MFRKLLKYDLRSIFKYWWITAISSMGISVIGGISIRALGEAEVSNLPDDLATWISIISGLGVFLCIIGLSAFLISAAIFIYVRFYQNFFSDEGYLTFTLPVKRRQLLDSKLISALIVNVITTFVLLLDAIIILSIGFGEFIFTSEIFKGVFFFIGKLIEEIGMFSLIFAVESILLLGVLSVASCLLLMVCITFAALIAGKHKVFAAIGTYYVVNAAVSFVSQIAMFFTPISIAGILSNVAESAYLPLIALMIFAITAMVTAFVAVLYTIELYMLDKKLNLS